MDRHIGQARAIDGATAATDDNKQKRRINREHAIAVVATRMSAVSEEGREEQHSSQQKNKDLRSEVYHHRCSLYKEGAARQHNTPRRRFFTSVGAQEYRNRAGVQANLREVHGNE